MCSQGARPIVARYVARRAGMCGERAACRRWCALLAAGRLLRLSASPRSSRRNSCALDASRADYLHLGDGDGDGDTGSRRRLRAHVVPPLLYIRRHVVEHAAAGRMLDERFLTAEFLLFVDAARLASASLGRAGSVAKCHSAVNR